MLSFFSNFSRLTPINFAVKLDEANEKRVGTSNRCSHWLLAREFLFKRMHWDQNPLVSPLLPLLSNKVQNIFQHNFWVLFGGIRISKGKDLLYSNWVMLWAYSSIVLVLVWPDAVAYSVAVSKICMLRIFAPSLSLCKITLPCKLSPALYSDSAASSIISRPSLFWSDMTIGLGGDIS